MGSFCNNCEISKDFEENQFQKKLIKSNKKCNINANIKFFPSDVLSSFSNRSSLNKNNRNGFLKEINEEINFSSLELIDSLTNYVINNNNYVDNFRVIYSATKITKVIKGYLFRIKFNNILKFNLIKDNNKLLEDITKYININFYIKKYYSSKNIHFINNNNINNINIFQLLNNLKLFLYKKMNLKNDITNNKKISNYSIKIVYDKKYYINKLKFIYQNDNINIINNIIKIYFGTFDNDVFIEGIIINLINKIILIGKFNEEELINDKGIKINYNIYKTISLYYGQLNQSTINGFGKIIFLNTMEKYKGQFIKEIFHGNGHFYSKNGDQYKGFFMYGKITGYGALFKKNGDKYEGKFLNGLLHGNGKIILSNGSTYACEFEQGKIKGQGYCIQDEGSLLCIN